MADNVEVDSGTGITVATDDVGSAHYQRVKVVWGADGTVADASASDPLPVDVENLVAAGTEGSPSAEVISVQGTAAHDSAGAMAPVLGGLKAIPHGTNPTAVTTGDASFWYGNLHGVPWVMGGHPNVVSRSHIFTTADTITDLALVTISTALKCVVTQVSAKTGAAVTVNTSCCIGFGAANVPSPSTAGTAGILLHGQFEGGAGQQVGNGSGIIGVGSTAEDLRITASAPTGGPLYVTYSYYTIES
jgi:hypothetical protein